MFDLCDSVSQQFLLLTVIGNTHLTHDGHEFVLLTGKKISSHYEFMSMFMKIGYYVIKVNSELLLSFIYDNQLTGTQAQTYTYTYFHTNMKLLLSNL